MSVADVLTGKRAWHVERADLLAWLPTLPPDSCSLCFFSPPYERARTYGIDFALAGQDWVDWMVGVFHACRRVCTGLVACVCEGQTRGYRYSAAPALLMADLHRAGFNLRKPPVYHRVGIPGSGGPDWLRNDYEFVVCATRGGKLPWSDNTAMGHPPKWAPGGEMSHRLSDGSRRNEWGMQGGSGMRRANGKRRTHGVTKDHTKTLANGGMEHQSYTPPVLANPGNIIKVRVGGGLLGSDLAHENEAPFPELLAEWFVRGWCPPGGVVIDPFSGSGTTGAVAVRCGRRYLGCDVRESQVTLSRRRIEGVTPELFTGSSQEDLNP